MRPPNAEGPPGPEVAEDGALTPARFLSEFLAGFHSAGPGPEAQADSGPLFGGGFPLDLASAGRLVSGLRTRAERTVQRLLAEHEAASQPADEAGAAVGLRTSSSGPPRSPVVVDAAFLRAHGLSLLAGLVAGPPPGQARTGAEEGQPEVSRTYRPYRLDLVSVASELLVWAGGLGDDLQRQLGLNASDLARLLPDEARAFLPGSLGDLVGAATGLVAGLVEEARQGGAAGLSYDAEEAVAVGWALEDDDGPAAWDGEDDHGEDDAQEAADERDGR